MYIGIDLGGTNIAVGLVDDNGKIIAKDSTPTHARRHYSEIIKDMAELSINLTKNNGLSVDDITAAGIGCPGTIDTKNGIVVYSNNIKMDHTPVAEEFKKYINVPVNVENDANAAAYGEYIINGNGAESFVFITLGTGVGGGVVIDGKIYRGFNNAGGELGHTTLIYKGEPCTCGKLGCWEAYASVTALIRQTELAIRQHPESMMKSISEQEGKISGKVAFIAAKNGDAAANEVVKQYIEYVAEGVSGIVNIFQPEKLLIGGGISREGDYLLNPIKEYVKNNDYNKYMPKVDIGIATLYNDAGIIGAALAAKNL